MKTKRNLAIQRAKEKVKKKTPPAFKLTTINKFVVREMNLKNNNNTLLKRASILGIWEENQTYEVQIELTLYDDQDNWVIEYCYPINGPIVHSTAQAVRIKQLREKQSYDTYGQFVNENKEKMINYLLHDCEATKDQLVL